MLWQSFLKFAFLTFAKLPAMSLSISALSPHAMFFEVRHAHAYRLWDRSGELWARASKEWSGVTLVNPNPAKVDFSLDGRYTIASELARTIIRDHLPTRNTETFAQLADLFIGLLCEVFEVSMFTRVGFRVKYWKEYPSLEDAAEAIQSLRLVNLPSGTHFGIENSPREHLYRVRYEGENVGVSLHLRNIEMTAEIELSIEATWSEISPVKVKKVVIEVDLDYYTKKQTDIGQLSVQEWILNADHIIRRDIDIFLST